MIGPVRACRGMFSYLKNTWPCASQSDRSTNEKLQKKPFMNLHWVYFSKYSKAKSYMQSTFFWAFTTNHTIEQPGNFSGFSKSSHLNILGTLSRCRGLSMTE